MKPWLTMLATALVAGGCGQPSSPERPPADPSPERPSDDPESPAPSGSPADPETPDDADLAEARGLATDFMGQLKGALQRALEDEGAPGALGICREQAPSIAGELSERRGWAVGRTALRVRNPRNAPDIRERAVLLDFGRRHAAGEPFADMEHAAIHRTGGQRYLHYMKAIPIGGLCVTCHGTAEQIAPAVQSAIDGLYPTDAATGFAVGDLRGAFTFVKVLPVQ